MGEADMNGHPLMASTTEEEAQPIDPVEEEPPPYESVVLGEAQPDTNEAPLQFAEPTTLDPDTASASQSVPASGVYGAPVNPDFEITVTEPVKQGEGVAAYVSYKVSTKCRLPQYQRTRGDGEHVVIRRFRDFVWLQRRLRKEHRGIIIPALPEKNVVEKYKMTTDFVEHRRMALEIFLRRVAAHPALKRSPDLQLFLEASETEFAIEVSRTEEDSQTRTTASGATGAARKTLDGAVKLFKSLGSQVSSTAGGFVSNRPSTPEEEDDGEYMRVKAYIEDLEPQVAEVHKQAARLVRQQAELATAIQEFGAALAALGRHEGTPLFGTLEEGTAGASKLCMDTSEALSAKLEVPMKEFYRSVRAAKKVTADRAVALAAKSQAKADVAAKRARLVRIKATPGVREERIAEAEKDLRDAQRTSQEAAEVYAGITAKMKAELARFQRERAREMCWVLRDFAEEEFSTASKTAKVWNDVREASSSAAAVNEH